MPTCMSSQNAAELGISWCGAGKRTNAMTAIQPNSRSQRSQRYEVRLGRRLQAVLEAEAAHRRDREVLERDPASRSAPVEERRDQREHLA
jgi:hypothetical protein